MLRVKVINLNENKKAISEFLFIGEEIENLKSSDLVIVLGNDNISDIAKCFDSIYKAGKINKKTKIILSGKGGILDSFKVKECFRIRRELINNYGYPKSMFILEPKATNIYENLEYSKKMVNLDDYKMITMIAAPFALRRTKLCANKIGYPMERVQFVGIVDTIRNINKETWWKNKKSRTRVYTEIERIGKYLSKGDLEIK